MSFADPQSVTIGAVTVPLPRISVGNRASEYQSDDGRITLKASSALGNSRTRRVLRLDHSKVASDVFAPDRQVVRSMSCYLVFDLPQYGYTNAEALDVYRGLKTQMTAGTDALITKLLGGES